jgi:hypothetical protein
VKGLVLTLAVVGCAAEHEGTATKTEPPPRPVIALVDSVRVPAREKALWHVRIGADSVKPIPDVLVDYAPTLVGDTVVVGVRLDSSGSPADLFRYNPRSRSLSFSRIGDRLRQSASNIAISPDGELAAILFVDDSGRAQAQLSRLADDVVLALSVPLLPARRNRFSRARWKDSIASVEFRLASDRIVTFSTNSTNPSWRPNRPLDSATITPDLRTDAQRDSAFGLVHTDSVFVISRPTLLSTFPITWQDLEGSEHAGEALNDYGTSLFKAGGPLRKAGVDVHATNDIQLRWRDSLGLHSIGSEKDDAILYVFITPDGRSRVLSGTVQRHGAILESARKHFGIALPDPPPL